VRTGLVGTEHLLFLVVLYLSPCLDVVFLYQTEWSYDREWHLPHTEADGHCGKVCLIGQVHQSRVDDIILMVPEGNLVATQFLSEVEELLATVPRTEETRLLLFAEVFTMSIADLKAGGYHMQGNVQCAAELFEIRGICLVLDVLHPHMDRFHLESWVLYASSLSQQFRQQKGVLATG
jgi:hypothetical protein